MQISRVGGSTGVEYMRYYDETRKLWIINATNATPHMGLSWLFGTADNQITYTYDY